MPWLNEITAAVTSSQPPQPNVAARVRSVRGARREIHSNTPIIASGRREQPGDLAAVGGANSRAHPVSPHIGRPGRRRADAAGLVTGQPAEPVVPHDQLDAPSWSATRRCTVASRPATARRSPPTSRRRRPSPRTPPAGDRSAAARSIGAATAYIATNPGSTRNACRLLARKASPTNAPASAIQRQRATLGGPAHRPGGAHQQEHEHRVGVVEAEHQRRHRGQRQDGTGDEAGRGAEPAPHRRVQDADRGHAEQRLRHQDRPGAQPEEPHAQAPSATATPAACRP